MEYLTLGRILDSHGLDGTIKIYSSSYFAKDRYKPGTEVYFLDKEEQRKVFTVVSFRTQGDINYVRFKEITNREDAQLFKGCLIQIEKEKAVLPKGYFLFSDLEGCKIMDSKNESLGVVSKVEEFPAQITLRVHREGQRDFFVPFIDHFIEKVDIKNKTITIKLIGVML